jgi:NAD(P)H-hydrate epimerase
MNLPSWLVPLPDAAHMREIDRWAIEDQRVASLDLMERAGRGLAALVDQVAPDGVVAVVCGKGNNGGDGLVVARLLRERGRAVDVMCIAPADELSGDARRNLERLPGPPPVPFVNAAALGESAVVVDALLGTGFSGAPRGDVAAAIDAINASGRPVVSADVPSGVDASTGAAADTCVRAVATATFHTRKVGLCIAPGKTRAGRVEVVEIGIPAGAPAAAQADVGLIGAGALREIPARHTGSTKFTEGTVAVAGGSRGLTGAPSLAALAAARAGAGYVTVLVPASLEEIFEIRLLEQMTRGLPDRDGALGQSAVSEALGALERADALVLGPGLGRSTGAERFARDVAAQAPIPLLLDADGLNAHAGDIAALARRAAPTVLTPHAGELGRLLDVASAEIEATRLAHAREAAAASGAVVVLKGDDTLVAEPGGTVAVSPGGSAALATAGTGDVLSGAIGALLAKGLDAFTAACAGVFLHGEAGRLAAAAVGDPGAGSGVVAGDVVAALPRALASGR